MNHVVIAPIDQHIGDLLLNGRSSGDREEMRLALLLCDVDEVRCRKTARLAKHRPGDGDLVVLRKPADDFARRLIDGGEPLRKLSARLGLYSRDHLGKNVVEQSDLLI